MELTKNSTYQAIQTCFRDIIKEQPEFAAMFNYNMAYKFYRPDTNVYSMRVSFSVLKERKEYKSVLQKFQPKGISVTSTCFKLDKYGNVLNREMFVDYKFI